MGLGPEGASGAQTRRKRGREKRGARAPECAPGTEGCNVRFAGGEMEGGLGRREVS